MNQNTDQLNEERNNMSHELNKKLELNEIDKLIKNNEKKMYYI